MSEPRTEYERWTQLVDRQADDQVLTPDELSFCQNFERTHPLCALERTAYAQLAELDGTPTEASRALVDRALQKLDADEAEQALQAARLLRGPRISHWLALGGAVAVALCALIVWRANRPNPPARILMAAHGPADAETDEGSSRRRELPLARCELVFTSGEVTVSGVNAGAGRSLLPEGAVVATGDGAACVLIDSDINVCLAAHSRMRMVAIASAARRIELEAGKLATRLSTQPPGMSLSITADAVSSTAVGTAFSVERAGQFVVTTVLNGKVRVGRQHHDARRDNRDERVIVNAHERAATGHDRASVTTVSRSEEAPSWALLGPTVLWHDPVTASLNIEGAPEGTEAWLDGQLIGHTPLYSLLPVGAHRVVLRNEGHELLAKELHAVAGGSENVVYEVPPTAAEQAARRGAATEAKSRSRSRAARAAEKSGAVSATRESNANASDSQTGDEPAAWLRSARRAVRTGRYADAAQTYERLIKSFSSSDEARTALVLLGQLRLNRLSDPRGALRALESYLAEGGSLELEASAARIDALHQLKRSAEEARAIDEFLLRHPASFEAKALRARVAGSSF